MAVEYKVPDLSDSQILRFVCGIRPCRAGGLRLETERIAGKRVVHNYGHGGCGVTLALGCAHDIVGQVQGLIGPDQSRVAVLGGGVTGLASAMELLRAGYAVSVHAEAFACDTTSNIAGALWLPTGIDFPEPGAGRDRFNGLLRLSHTKLVGLDAKRWGVQELPVFEPAFAEHHPEFFESGAIAAPRPLVAPDGEVPGLDGGRVFRTLFIDTPRFMTALYEEVIALGGVVVERSFSSLGEIASLDESVLVNCLAMGSRGLFGDELIFPARGLLVHMKPQRLGYVYHDGYRYMFPRENALILGGTYEPGVCEPPADDGPYFEILNRHRAKYETVS